MSAREELAAALAGPRFVPHGRNESGERGEHVHVSQQLADALAGVLLVTAARMMDVRTSSSLPLPSPA